MAKGKNSIKQEKQQPFITEEDRNNSPIFKTIYKRIRNLNKKLATIEILEKLDPGSLDAGQQLKVASRHEIEKQIQKNESFALFYKDILIENNGFQYDNSQQIIKIATLLNVGQSIDRQPTKPSGPGELLEVYNGTYKKVTICPDVNKPLPQKIADTFVLLRDYLKKPESYQACQDYISYFNQQNRAVPEQNLVEKNAQSLETVPSNKIVEVERQPVKQSSIHIKKMEEKPEKVPQVVQKYVPKQSITPNPEPNSSRKNLKVKIAQEEQKPKPRQPKHKKKGKKNKDQTRKSSTSLEATPTKDKIRYIEKK